MIFTTDHIHAILSGQKTRTTRRLNPKQLAAFIAGEQIPIHYRVGSIHGLQPGRGKKVARWMEESDTTMSIIYGRENITYWTKGKYATVPLIGDEALEAAGYHKARIRICSVDVLEDVRKINYDFAAQEGYGSVSEYLAFAWMPINDQEGINEYVEYLDYPIIPGLKNSADDFLMNENFWMYLHERPEKFYAPALSYTFEVVK